MKFAEDLQKKYVYKIYDYKVELTKDICLQRRWWTTFMKQNQEIKQNLTGGENF